MHDIIFMFSNFVHFSILPKFQITLCRYCFKENEDSSILNTLIQVVSTIFSLVHNNKTYHEPIKKLEISKIKMYLDMIFLDHYIFGNNGHA